MFKKIVSNLAFSPALVGQLGFYAKRLKKEEATRRLGLVFTALALVVQSFAVFSPPESANASSPNDFVRGGVSSASEFIRHYDANENNIKDLFNTIGIARTDLDNTSVQTVSNKDVYSWGLLPRFSASQGERSYTIRTSSNTLKTFYYRPLSLWYNGQSASIKMLVGKTKSGLWFGVMYECGNLVLKVLPPEPKCPDGMIGTYPNCTEPPKKCPIPGKENLPLDSSLCKPDPVAQCTSLSIAVLSNKRYQFTGKASTLYGATVSQYTYTVKKDGKVVDTKSISTSELSSSYVYTQTTKGTYTVTLSVSTSLGTKTSADCAKSFNVTAPEVCAVNPKLPKSSPECQPCPGNDTLWIKDVKCTAAIIQTKSAINTSQNSDATKVVAKAGDRITYSLNIENKGLAPASVNVREQLDDVLQYSTVINDGSGNLASDILSWPAITLNPGEKQTRMFTVEMLAKIPTMPTGTSDGSSYDCKMTNTFGNTVDIAVNCPAEKQLVEQTVAELPHTGPTENMIFAGIVLTIVTYFYARSRQIKKEVRLIRRDLNAGTI